MTYYLMCYGPHSFLLIVFSLEKNLTVLTMRSNRLQRVPGVIGGLTSLESLCFAQNMITVFPFEKVRCLKALDTLGNSKYDLFGNEQRRAILLWNIVRNNFLWSFWERGNFSLKYLVLKKTSGLKPFSSIWKHIMGVFFSRLSHFLKLNSQVGIH